MPSVGGMSESDRARADAEAGADAGFSSAESSLVLALLQFQKWVTVLYQNSLARRNDQGIIEVAPPVAQRFCIGFSGDCIVVGAPREEIAWARLMPWSHAALYQGRSTMHLVSERAEFDGGMVPPFALAFDCDADIVRGLESYGSLQIREILKRPPGSAIAELSKNAFGHMPFYLLEQDEEVMEARGRNMLRRSAGMGV